MSDEPQADDVLEQGSRRFPLPSWRPSRGAVAFAAATLIAGLAAGYAAGYHQHRGSAALPTPARTASPSQATVPVSVPAAALSLPASLALSQDTGGCSVQHGRELQLGVQITNRSAAPVTLQTASAVLPLKGQLKPVTRQWAPCGALANEGSQGDDILLPGASIWLTFTFQVQVRCPGAAPVQFTVGYLAAGYSAEAILPGFADLTQVPYSGCPGYTGLVLRSS